MHRIAGGIARRVLYESRRDVGDEWIAVTSSFDKNGNPIKTGWGGYIKLDDDSKEQEI